jgi:fructokinase
MSNQDHTLVAGEALFDLWLDADGEVRGRPGGGPFNTARTLGRLGRRVTYLGALSSDGLGRRLRTHLAEDGVALDAVVNSSAPSTLALADIDERGTACYGFWRDGTAASSLLPEAALAAIPAGVTTLHIGTLGLVFEPMAAAMEAIAVRLAPQALIVVDPNVRPAAIDDEQGYRERLGRVLALATVVKVSDEDVAWLFPGMVMEDAARALLRQGPKIVLVTRGADGVTVLTASACRRVSAPKVRVADTIGAGDAFTGGFLAAWRPPRGVADDLDAAVEAAAYGALVASMTCERVGASPPTLNEVQARQRDSAAGSAVASAKSASESMPPRSAR